MSAIERMLMDILMRMMKDFYEDQALPKGIVEAPNGKRYMMMITGSNELVLYRLNGPLKTDANGEELLRLPSAFEHQSINLDLIARRIELDD